MFYKTEYARKCGKVADVGSEDDAARQDSKRADGVEMAARPVISVPSRGPPLPSEPAPLTTADCCCSPPSAEATAQLKKPLGGEDVDILFYTTVDL